MTDMIDIKQTTRLLRVQYTEREKLALGDQMANAIRNLKQAESELDSIRGQYAGRMKQLRAEVETVAEKLNTGWEMKSVDCDEVKDFSTGTFILRRFDTGEHIEERALTAEERQMGLFDKKEEETPTGLNEGQQAEPGVEGAEATPEPPHKESIGVELADDTNPFYTNPKPKA